MQSQNVTFGNSGNNKSFFGVAKDAAINVGGTMLIGGAAGSAAGHLVALVPHKPNAAQLNHQYVDIFEKAVMNNDLPEFLKNKAGDIAKNAQPIASNISKLNEKAATGSKLLDKIAKNSKDDILKNDEFLTKASEFLGADKKLIEKNSLENVTNMIKSHLGVLKPALESENASLQLEKAAFITEARTVDDIVEIAKKGAKHLRKRTIVGVGIAIGIMGALTLNLLKTYGVIGKKSNVQQNPAMPAKQAPSDVAANLNGASAIKPLGTHQG